MTPAELLADVSLLWYGVMHVVHGPKPLQVTLTRYLTNGKLFCFVLFCFVFSVFSFSQIVQITPLAWYLTLQACSSHPRVWC